MRFRLSNAGYRIDEERKIKYEKLGLTFKYTDEESIINYEKNYIEDYRDVYIEINTLDELMTLIKDVGTLIIDEKSIVIYDDYVE